MKFTVPRRWLLSSKKKIRHFIVLTVSTLILPMTVLFIVLKSSALVANEIQYEPISFDGFNNETGVNFFLVPNIIHFIRFNLPEYSFVDYVIMRAAMRNHRPDYFFIHTNVPAESFHGKYWDLIRQDREMWSRIQIHPLEPPSEIFGQKLGRDYHLWHAADIERIRIVMKYGGIYLDNDVFVVQNLDKYRRFECAMNWENNLYLSNQVTLMTKRSKGCWNNFPLF